MRFTFKPPDLGSAGSPGFRTVSVAVIALVMVLAPLAGVILFDTAQAAESVNSCRTIDSPGLYELTSDITNLTTESCIEITSSDVIFDGQGHTIEKGIIGAGVNVSTTSTMSNVTVRDVTVDGGDDAFKLYAPFDGVTFSDILLHDTTLDGATNDGLVLEATGDDATIDIELADNRITNVTDDGMDLNADGDDSDVTLAVTRNDIDAGNDGIEDVEFRGTNTTANVSIIGNVITGGNDGIEDIFGDSVNQTVTLRIADNNVTSDDDGIEDIEMDDDETVADISIVNNSFTVGDDALDIVADHANQSVTVGIEDNEIVAGTDGIEDVDVDGARVNADISIVNNRINASDDAIQDIHADENDAVVTIRIEDNTFDAEDDGIEDIEVDDESVDANISIVNNWITASDGEAIQDIHADDDNVTVTLHIANNELFTTDDTIEDIEADGVGLVADISILNNTMEAGDEGIGQIHADGNDSIVTITVADNEITANTTTLELIETNGFNQTIDVTVERNQMDGFDSHGMRFEVQFLEAFDVDVEVQDNEIAGNVTAEDTIGIEIDPANGTEPPVGTLKFEFNTITDVRSAVLIHNGPVVGIEIHNNFLAGDDYGVENENTTDGTYVNATSNYWNASDGPNSTGPYEDPVTGTLADGSGSNVTNSTATLSNVHFDPFLDEPPVREEPDVVYWQVDFGEGDMPPDPPAYWPDDLMSALGNSEDGVTENPSVRRQRFDGQLGDVTIVSKSFQFDDAGNPTEVTVEFELDPDAETRDLHLAVFTLPGPFDLSEVDQQELHEVANGTFSGGNTGQLTVSIPQSS